MTPTARSRVTSIICNQLTNMFEEYIAEHIGEDILAEYYDGFTISQVAEDLDAALKSWANDENNVVALTELVESCADELP